MGYLQRLLAAVRGGGAADCGCVQCTLERQSGGTSYALRSSCPHFQAVNGASSACGCAADLHMHALEVSMYCSWTL